MGKTTLNTFFRRRKTANLTSKPMQADIVTSDRDREQYQKRIDAMRKAFDKAPVYKLEKEGK